MVEDFDLYPVSILKPLKGVDDGLRENLRSFFQLEYPRYELIFCLAEAEDPAHALVQELMVEYPGVDARIFIGESRVGPNPKVNNMLAGYGQAKYDQILISDSNVRVRHDYLRRMVPHLADPQVGMVTAIVAGVQPEGWGGIMEAAFLNTFYARCMTLAFYAGKPCVVGKSMLFSRAAAQRFGGLKVLGRYLAEDFMAGEAMSQLGLKVVLMQDPVEQFLGKYSFQQFWSRHVRWGRIRKSQAPLIFPLELLQNSLCAGAFGVFSVPRLLDITATNFLLAHFAVWAVCDLFLISRVNRTGFSLRRLHHWAAREIITLPLFFQVFANNTVQWRGQKLRLGIGGVIE